jgi:endo-1,4-beta-xylanase
LIDGIGMQGYWGIDYPNITSVTFFGLKDHYVAGDKTNARLFDKDCNPKPAFDAVLQIFKMLYQE